MKLSAVIFWVVYNLTVGLEGMVNATTSISKHNQLVCIRIIHGMLHELGQLLCVLVSGELFNILSVENNVWKVGSILAMNSLNIWVKCPPNCTFGDVFISKQSQSTNRTVSVGSFEKNRHLYFLRIDLI